MSQPTLSIVTPDPAAPSLDDVQAWINDPSPRSVLDVLVTPAIAALLLHHNHPGETNRRMSKAGVAMAVQALRSGAWENTGEPVIMSDQGLLNDGQHRLAAIAETGIPARMDLRFGVPRHAFAATNSGGKRTGADALLLVGASNAVSAASVARLVLTYEIGLPAAARQRIANSAIVRAVERWPDIPEAIKFAAHLPAVLRSAPIQTLAFFAVRTANEAAVRQFFGVLESGEGHANNLPHRLREALLRHRGGQDTGTRVRFLALGIIAWNAWRATPRTLTRLDWKKNEPFPRVADLVL